MQDFMFCLTLIKILLNLILQNILKLCDRLGKYTLFLYQIYLISTVLNTVNYFY